MASCPKASRITCSVVSGQGVQAFVEPTRKECRQKLVLGKELAIGRSPHAPHRTLLLPE